MSRLPIVLLLSAVVVAACARPAAQPSPSPSTSPTPLPVATTPAPTPTPTIPTPTPAVFAATAAPAAPALPSKRVTTVDPAPRIIDIALSEHVVHSGDTVFEHVRTSLNTASVEARIGGYSTSLPKTGAGMFSGSYKVPWLPFFIHGGFDIVVIARNTEGVQSRRIVHISVQ